MELFKLFETALTEQPPAPFEFIVCGWFKVYSDAKKILSKNVLIYVAFSKNGFKSGDFADTLTKIYMVS